ncbi:serine/threonine protein kinase [Patescibacteria group bacterium]|nr:serine/threonine protein kinase [Patescibacteria group bacterium]MBU4016035.1 serine/threonine protein kinase [Patescibacteria group bacterium]MBU4099196.1 serine/threonine protein kinase [Patescibacteria group bacterium]
MIGKNINGYKIEKFIGKGQFGEVYKATKNNNVFAIKFIRKEFIYDDINEARFIREVSALKKVNSKYAVALVGDGEYIENNTSYRMIIMEFVEGETLREIRNKDPKAWKDENAIGLTIEILKGLQDIHKAGIIHRDLKPENIKITKSGVIKILDYGLSKIIDYSSITQTGQPIGTYFYMSPEQAKGEKPLKDGSDYYSVGVILYELLTGKILFYPSTPAQIIHKTISVKPPYPTSINPEIPNHIENVVLKLLSKEVYQRYSSISDIIKALEEKQKESIPEKADKVKFYLRTIQNDTSILEDFLKGETIDGVDFPINLHAQYKKILSLIRGKGNSIDFIADPSTNRLAYTNFRKTKGLKELPYAPDGYDALTAEDFEDERYLKEFVGKVIELQVENGCNILTAPFFYFDNTSDDWFQINLKLLREGIDYVRKKSPQYKVSGAICTQAELLCRAKERKIIIEDYGNCGMDYLQFFIDKISESVGDAQLYNFILTAKEIKNYGKTKIIANRVPVVALGLLTIGFDAISSGLGILDNFTKSLIVKEEDNIRMPTKYYFRDLLLAVPFGGNSRLYQDIIAEEDSLQKEFPELNLKLKCECEGCSHVTFSENFSKPRLHFLHAMKEDIQEINTINPSKSKDYIIARMDKAYKLQQKLTNKGIKLNSPSYLNLWKEIVLKF